MANIKSAKKRIKITARRKDENKGKKTELATAIKKFRALVDKKELKEAAAFLPKVSSLIDSGNSHGRLHKNTANRKKARLAEMLDKALKGGNEVATEPKAVEVKPEVVKAEVKVEEAKPATAKKTAVKKPVAEKEAAPKPAAKKPAVKKTETVEAKPATAKKPAAKKPAIKKEQA